MIDVQAITKGSFKMKTIKSLALVTLLGITMLGGVAQAEAQTTHSPSALVEINSRRWIGEGVWNYTASVENQELISAPLSWDLEGLGSDTSLSMNYWIDAQENLIIDYDLSGYPSAQKQNLIVHLSSGFYGVMSSEAIIDPVSKKGRSMIKAQEIRALVANSYDIDPRIYVYPTQEEEWHTMVMGYRLPLGDLLKE